MGSFQPFSIARLPEILFGSGCLAELPARLAAFGQRLLIVTGERSFVTSAHWPRLVAELDQRQMTWRQLRIADEPSPAMLEQALAEHRSWSPQVVLGIGGGSVLDAAKAMAGLLPVQTQVLDHLEGVGRGLAYEGPALPFVAVPTTAGTGSEATKNAVLSERGPQGYKKSFRHDSLVARLAVVDPDLLASCPPEQMAAQGMDAFTQLLESYVSTRANPMTDALAWSGMEAFRDGFFTALAGDPAGRARIAYGALMSGICLAQTGLGSVHGLASPLGAMFPVPHGVVCGSLLAEALDINLAAMTARDTDNPALAKYTALAAMMGAAETPGDAQPLVELLRQWVERLEIPRLSAYGMRSEDIPRVLAGISDSSMKTNPIALNNAELGELLRRRL